MSVDSSAILQQARTWSREGQRVAVATVVGTWSSSPRPLGSQMAIAPGARFEGSVSGGCVEAAVIAAADELFAGGRPRTLRYGVSTEQAWEVGLPCGGSIEVWLRELSRPLLDRLGEALEQRQTLVLVSELESGVEQIWDPAQRSHVADAALAHALSLAVQRDQSQLVELGERRWFVHAYAAPLRLVVVGAVHLTQALAALARFSE